MGESKIDALSASRERGWGAELHDELILWESTSIQDVQAVLAEHPEKWRSTAIL